MKFLEDLGSKFNQIDLSEFAEIVNETHIILIAPSRFRGWPPNIREDKF
jgi:hypothetical protein